EVLAVDRVVVVELHRRRPGSAVVVGMLEFDVRVVAAIGRLLGPDEVGPPSVCAAAPVPGQIGFGVDRPIWLSRDGVEPAYGAVCDEDRRVEAGPAEAVGVHRREDVGSTLSTF